MTLQKITLLSAEEYIKYQSIIPVIKDGWWWLRSPGFTRDIAARVLGSGRIAKIGVLVNYDDCAIRPALRLTLDPSDIQFWYRSEKLIGTKIKYGNYQWTILNAKFGKIYVLCDDIIAKHRFDSKLNNWNTSELKQWLKTEGLSLITG